MLLITLCNTKLIVNNNMLVRVCQIKYIHMYVTKDTGDYNRYDL